MARPVKERQVDRIPDYVRFCAQGRASRGHGIIMTVEEYETLRLIDYLGLTQEACAGKMGVGRGTVQSLYTSARKKLARFLWRELSWRSPEENLFSGMPSDRPAGRMLPGQRKEIIR